MDVFQSVTIFVDRKFFVYVGDVPLLVPKNGGVDGTHRGAYPTKDCQHKMKHAK